MQIAQVLSTWTPAQIKKHAECYFKQNLKTNSAAVKWYQESLSPNWKTQVMVKHTTVQLKYQQPFSPEDSAQILNENTAAHRKQQESLPPKKKARLLDTNAAAHKRQQESLSPDDEIQIKKKMLMHAKSSESLFFLTTKFKF